MPPKKRKTVKKKQEAKKRETPLIPPYLIRDIWGVFLISLSILIFLSLQSYTPLDPSLKTFGSGMAFNSGGRIGAVISDVLVDGMGMGSYLLILFTMFSGINSIRSIPRKSSAQKDIGYAIFLVSFCASLRLWYLGSYPNPFQGTSPGGFLGDLLVSVLFLPLLGKYGSSLVICTCFVFAIRLIISMPFHRFWVSTRTPKVPKVKVKRVREKLREKLMDNAFEKDAPSPCLKVLENEEPEYEPVDISTKKKSKKEKKIKQAKKEEKKQEFVPQSVLGTEENYNYPPVSFLDDSAPQNIGEMNKEMIERSEILENKLKDFGITGEMVNVHPGPVITMYEFEPSAGIKVNRIANLSDDLAMAMRAVSIRIVAPIPGKAAIGIEIPNKKRDNIYLKDIINSPQFAKSKSKLTLALGHDIFGKPVVSDLAKMPHLLIAGATGAGKSVTLNTLICSMLFNANPHELRMVMVDPKMLELGIYEGIPHLLAPVVTDPKKAAAVLKWAVKEMENRYKLLSEKKVRNITQYNNVMLQIPQKDRGEHKPLPYIVMVIDEYADLMMTSSKDVEHAIVRLAQMARAIGIHLIIATQRPSVDVITGLIKANFPSRISFRVSSKIDSRTILDSNGAEKLLGKGDMMFLPPSSSNITRIHGAMVTESEVIKLVDFLSNQRTEEFQDNIMNNLPEETNSPEAQDEETDEFFKDAVELVRHTGQASASMIQRRFRVGYNRAARMVEVMEKKGIVGPAEGGKPRKVIHR